MKPAISLGDAAFLLALAAFAAAAWAGHLHQASTGPCALVGVIAGSAVGLYAAAVLLCLFQCINRLIEWRADIRHRRTHPQPTNHR